MRVKDIDGPVEKRECGKCGAPTSRIGADTLCAACLLEAALIEDETNPATSRLLMDFGDYELLEELGRGGQGVVYRARQKGLNRIVALKIIGLGHWATEAHLKRFRTEAEAAAQLDHPSIVPIYDIGEREGACFFSMKLIDGCQLDELAKHKALTVRESVALLAKVARTVHYAHEHGVLHRDLKPGNILIDSKGEPHLTDFGLARLVEKESNITRTMDVLGTPSYMAPEQAMGKNAALTRVTDVYGLGAVFYQLLTGQPPFAGGTTYETIRLVLETEPRRPRLWNPKVDGDIETICLKCLEKDPQKRYPTAEAIAEDLGHWLRYEPISARPSNVFTRTRKWIRRNPATAVLVPCLAALVMALVLLFWKAEPGPPPTGIAVLPFEDLSGDKENAFFADGIQDDVLTKLAKIADLKVISRTSVMGYRGERNIRKIGGALRISHVLEGSVRRVDGRIRVNAQIIDARTDTHVWAETFERPQAEIFALESELAEQVAARLRARLSGTEKSALGNTPTQDLEANELYLRAKVLGTVGTSDQPAAIQKLTNAVELLEKATKRDPTFALAYCLLTQTNLNLYWYAGRTDVTRRDRAEAALRAAQRLAPAAGETHLAQAFFYHYSNLDYDRALQELDVAARLLPNSAEVFRASALIERRLGRWKDALRHFARASELDPRDPALLAQLAITNWMLRRYSEAEQIDERGLASLPEAADDFWKGKGDVALAQGDIEGARTALQHISVAGDFPVFRFYVHLLGGEYGEAERMARLIQDDKDEESVQFMGIPELMAIRAQGDATKVRSCAARIRAAYEAQLQREPVEPGVLSEAGIIDAALGHKDEALAKCLRAVEMRPIARDAVEGPEYVANLALAYAWLGERDRAFEQLFSIAHLPHTPSYGDLKFNPVWSDLRDDPRFQKILEEAAKPLPL